MYKQYIFSRQNTTMIFRASDSTWISADMYNTDYRKYLEWVEQGNVAEVVNV